MILRDVCMGFLVLLDVVFAYALFLVNMMLKDVCVGFCIFEMWLLHMLYP